MLTDIPSEGGNAANPLQRRAGDDNYPKRSKHLKKSHRIDESRQDSWIDRARQGVHCSVFCGGKKCKFERWSALSAELKKNAAIEGLNSNWVGPDAIASQRPSTSLFLKFLLIQQFRSHNVSGVVNLQEKGEHGSCGPDGILESTGYSYSGAEDLMPNNISYYVFPWPDMTAPEQDVVLRSVQVMDYHIKNKGKVLVHCHAGLGRTGLMIACYYVYSHHMPSIEAIKLVRSSRPGAIQTDRQFKFICAFEKHIWRLSQAFCIEISDSRIDVELFVRRQRHILHGQESDLHRYTPAFLHSILCRLLNLTQRNPAVAEMTLRSLGSSSSPDAHTLLLYRTAINRRQFNVKEESNERLLAFLVCDWFRSMSTPALSSHQCDTIIAFQRGRGAVHVPCLEGSASEVLSSAKAHAEQTTARLVREWLSRPLRHTLGMVVSGVECISRHVTSEPVRRPAYCNLVDSFNHAFNPIKLRYAPVERELLYDFFIDWGSSVGDMYFNPLSAPLTSRTVRRVAQASVSTLAETAVFPSCTADDNTSSLHSPVVRKTRRMTDYETKKYNPLHGQGIFRMFFLGETKQRPQPVSRIFPQPSSPTSSRPRGSRRRRNSCAAGDGGVSSATSQSGEPQQTRLRSLPGSVEKSSERTHRRQRHYNLSINSSHAYSFEMQTGLHSTEEKTELHSTLNSVEKPELLGAEHPEDRNAVPQTEQRSNEITRLHSPWQSKEKPEKVPARKQRPSMVSVTAAPPMLL